MAETLDYRSFIDAIIKDFDNNTSGLEIELGKRLSERFGDIKLDYTKLRQAIKDALQVATRQRSNDVVDKIDLSAWIDLDPKKLKKQLVLQAKDISKYLEEIKKKQSEGAKETDLVGIRESAKLSAEAFIGVYRTAIARGLKIDAPEMGLDKAQMAKIEKSLVSAELLTKNTVNNINQYLSQIGVNVNSDFINSKIRLLTSDDLQSILDSVNVKFDSSKLTASLGEISKSTEETRGKIEALGAAYQEAIDPANSFADANERVLSSFGNLGNIGDAASKIGEYADKLGEATGKLNEVGSGANVGGGTQIASPIIQAQDDMRQASTETADVVVDNNRREVESFTQVAKPVEDVAARIAELKKQLRDYTFINHFNEKPLLDFEFDKNVEMAQFLKNTFEELSALDPSITIEKLLQEAQQEFDKTNDAVKRFNDTLQEVRKGTKEWSFNKFLNDVDGFAKRFNELAVQYDELIHTDNYDPKIALNLEARMHSMLAAEHQAYKDIKIFQPYIDNIQHQLNDIAQKYQDQFYDAIANGGNLMSRDDLKYAVEHQLGVKDYSFELEGAQKYLAVLQNIQQVLSYDGGQGAVDFYSKQIDHNIEIAEELKQRLINTSQEVRVSDPEWTQNQYKYITEHLQTAEEYKRKLAEVKGELYEITQIRLEDVTKDLQAQMGEGIVDTEAQKLQQQVDILRKAFASLDTHQTSSKSLFQWISENCTDAEKSLMGVSVNLEEFQKVLRGIEFNSGRTFSFATTLGLDTVNWNELTKAEQELEKFYDLIGDQPFRQWEKEGNPLSQIYHGLADDVRNGLKDAETAIKEFNTEKEKLTQTVSSEYVKKSDYEIYSSAMELAKKRESVLEDLAQREINLANTTSGETKQIYAEMAKATYDMFKSGEADGSYKIDEKIAATDALVKDLRSQLENAQDPKLVTSLNQQLDEAKVKLLTFMEVFKESSMRISTKTADLFEFGSNVVDEYWRTQRRDYQVGDSHYNIGVMDKEYLDGLTKGISSEQQLAAAIEDRKTKLIDLCGQIDVTENKERELREVYDSLESGKEKQTAFADWSTASDATNRIIENYNEIRQELYVLTELQNNWGKSLQDAANINVGFLDSEWREEEQVMARFDDMAQQAIKAKQKLAETPSGTGESSSQVKHETEVLRENTSERQRNTAEKTKGQQIVGDVNAGRVEEAQTNQVRQHTAAQEQLNDEMREGQQIQQEAATKPAVDKGEYTELTQQLKEVMNLVFALNTVIKRNRSTIGASANEQAKAFKGLYDALDQVNQKLAEIGAKKISINLSGFKDITGNKLHSVLEEFDNKLNDINNKKISISLGGLKDVESDQFAENIKKLGGELSKLPDKKININFSSLKNIDDLEGKLKAINTYLGNMKDKQVAVRLEGLNEISGEDITDKLNKLKEALMAFPENLKSIDLKGISNLNELLKMDADPKALADKFNILATAIRDFATELRNIPSLDNSSFLSSINNLIDNGDKLANVATIIKAKQSEINQAQNLVGTGAAVTSERQIKSIKAVEDALTKEREVLDGLVEEFNKANRATQEFDISDKIKVSSARISELESKLHDMQLPKVADYTNAIKQFKEYFAIKLKGKEATEDEIRKVESLESEWGRLAGKVDEVTQKLKDQGRSTKALADFTQMYATRTPDGMAKYIQNYIKSQAHTDPTEWINKNILPYEGKGRFDAKVFTDAKKLITDLSSAKIKDIVASGEIDKVEKLIERFKTLQNLAKDASGKLVQPVKISGLMDEISKYIKTYSGLSKDTKDQLRELFNELNNAGGKMTVSRFREIADELNGIKTRAREAGEETKSFWTRLGEQVNFTNAKMVGMYLSFYRIIGYIRQMTGAVIELDSALTELRKITGESTERMEQSFKASAVTAKELGSTIDAVISQTSDWSRLKSTDGRMATYAMELA